MHTKTTTDISHFLLLQLNDATFPIGSYSLSWGLETFVQQGYIYDIHSTKEYIFCELHGSFIYSELLPARLAWEAGNDNIKLASLDEKYEASRSPRELREGSRKLASRFIKTTSVWDTAAAGNTYVPVYFPVAYGVYCRIHNIPEAEMLGGFLYSQTSARVTTAVKLVPLSQIDGQMLLNTLLKSFPELIKKTLGLPEEDICRSCPGIDIRAMQHENLYTRLYIN